MRHICIWTNRVAHMGWLRLVGFSKLWVSFAKEPYKKDCILQKRLMILRSLLPVATPYIFISTSHTKRERDAPAKKQSVWEAHMVEGVRVFIQWILCETRFDDSIFSDTLHDRHGRLSAYMTAYMTRMQGARIRSIRVLEYIPLHNSFYNRTHCI